MREVRAATRGYQTGVTTLAITLILLVIITLMVIFATSVGFFEQRTATNQNRARLVQQAAEYSVNLAGEYIKANRNRIISDVAADAGWLATGSTRRWAKCSDEGSADSEFPTGHPCLSERDLTRRAQLYFWTVDGGVDSSRALPYTEVIPVATRAEAGMGGDAAFTTTTEVNALLCRLDTSDPADVQCDLDPTSGNRVALYLIGEAALTGEGAAAEVKEAWATYSSFVPSAAVPLIASGLVEGLGNGQIVASPNAGGYGLPASIWSPQDVDIDGSSGGVGSVSTCHIGDFLKSTPEAQLKTTCATSNTACGCDASSSTASTYLSGHVGSIQREREDILDVDGGQGSLPDVTFFPGEGMDDPADPTDDSIFEYTFALDYVVAEDDATGTTLENCGAGAQNCVEYAMLEEFQAEALTDCSSLSTASTGIIYVSGGCTSLPGNVGTADSPVILVIHQPAGAELRLNSNLVFFGMLFVHSDDQTAIVNGSGNPKIFGSLVVEGDVDFSGGVTIVYDDTSASGDTNKLPASAKFGRVPGSWLDSRAAF